MAATEVARSPHRVTIVGGGFAGLYAARGLGIDPEVRVTLVDRRNFHLFQPLLYQVATGALSPGRHRPAAPLDPAQAAQHDGHPRRGDRARPRAARGPAGRRRADRLRHADRRDRRPSHLLRPPRVGAVRARAQDDRGRDRDPAPDPDRLRGGRARGRSRAPARLDDLRDRRRRADRRRAGRRARRDRPRHAPARLPVDPPGRGADHPGRGDGPDPADLSGRSVGVGAATARAARRRGPDEDAGRRHRRGRRPGRPARTGRRGDDPDPDRAVGGGRPGRRASRGPSRRRRAPRPTVSGGSSSSPT